MGGTGANNYTEGQAYTIGVLSAWTLTVTNDGTDSGTVSSEPPGISCGTDCAYEFDDGTEVTLTAVAEPGSSFYGWSGACTGTEKTCTVVMDEDTAVTAAFGSDFDNDDVPDEVENQATAFNGSDPGDGNGDGVQDREQADVTSLPNENEDGMVTLANVNGKTQSQVRIIPEENAPMDSQGFTPDFSDGMISFKLDNCTPGQQIAMVVYLDRDESVNAYWKLNRNTDRWTDIADTIEHIGTKTVIAFHIEEGGPYDTDDDTTTITDPGGPGFLSQGQPIPSLKNWGLLLLIGFLMLGSMRVIKRRGANRAFNKSNGI